MEIGDRAEGDPPTLSRNVDYCHDLPQEEELIASANGNLINLSP
jgi:hypothetical protein